MTRRSRISWLIALLLPFTFVVSTARADDDHLECFKVRDQLRRTLYTADLSGLVDQPGCMVALPAVYACVPSDKTNVVPTPPGAAPGVPTNGFACYKVRCPRATLPPIVLDDQFGTRIATPLVSRLLCAPLTPAGATATTTTTTTPGSTSTAPPSTAITPSTTTTSSSTTTTTLCPVGDIVCAAACVNPASDPTNCGTCGTVCTAANGTPACAGGQCAIAACNPGFKDCDGQAANGCEVNTGANPNDCGACGTVCTAANGTPACAGGQCAIAACNPGFKDCDAQVADGCEVNTTSDPNNCGLCGDHCTAANGTAACTGGTCAVASCNSGFADCDSNPADGCETNIGTNPLDCGSCNHQCFVANGTAGCSAGTCTVASCTSSFRDCNNNPADGCETNTNNDPNNCGTCGHACATSCSGHVGSTTCSAGTCAITSCQAGFFNADGVCADGCECAGSTFSATCATASPIGTVPIGAAAPPVTGNLVPLGQEAYFTFTFPGIDTSPGATPGVDFLSNPGGEFAFDITSNCSGTLVSCSDLTLAQGRTSCGLTSAGTYFVHVYRLAGHPLNCDNFTLEVQN